MYDIADMSYIAQNDKNTKANLEHMSIKFDFNGNPLKLLEIKTNVTKNLIVIMTQILDKKHLTQ